MAASIDVLTWNRKLVFIVCGLYSVLVVKSETTFYSFTVDDIQGRPIPLGIFAGKPSLVVNVASECGYTQSHYEDLVWVSQQSAIANELNILAFPCNQFGAQEPRNDPEILTFVQQTYGVTFPVFSKIDVIGRYAHPAYTYLIGTSGKEVDWNFWKYLLDRRGRVIDAWGPTTSVAEIYDVLVAATRTKQSKRDEF